MPDTMKLVSSEAMIATSTIPLNISRMPKSFTQGGASRRLKSPKPTVVTTDVVK